MNSENEAGTGAGMRAGAGVVTVVTSGKAAPGVSTATWALALSWPRPLLVLDGDPAGGDMAAGLLAGRVSADRGLLSWSGSARRGGAAMAGAALFADHAVELPEHPDVWFLPGFTHATQGSSFTEQTWAQLAAALRATGPALDRDALLDTGRLTTEHGNGPLLRAADRVLLAVRPSVRSVHAAQAAATRLRGELGDLTRVSALVIGEGPYPASEVAAALEIPLAGALPLDPRTAAVLSDGAVASTRLLRRSPLLKAATRIATNLARSTTDVGSDQPDRVLDPSVEARA
jgi:hypothetical protein